MLSDLCSQVEKDCAGPIISVNMFPDTCAPELRPCTFLKGSGAISSGPWMDSGKGHGRCRFCFLCLSSESSESW